MKLTLEERRRRRERFAAMSPKEKLEHILLYYKGAILLVLAAVLALGYTVCDVLSRKEPVLHLAYLNVAVGAELEERLSGDYLADAGLDPDKTEIHFYRDLYLSETPAAADHEYAYTSKLKVMATIQSKLLDVVLMNREAYNLCSASGYLLDLTTLVPEGTTCLTENTVVLSDNAVELSLGQADTYVAETVTVCNAIELTRLPQFQEAGFSGEVYLGIIANTPRLEACRDYLEFLVG